MFYLENTHDHNLRSTRSVHESVVDSASASNTSSSVDSSADSVSRVAVSINSTSSPVIFQGGSDDSGSSSNIIDQSNHSDLNASIESNAESNVSEHSIPSFSSVISPCFPSSPENSEDEGNSIPENSEDEGNSISSNDTDFEDAASVVMDSGEDVLSISNDDLNTTVVGAETAATAVVNTSSVASSVRHSVRSRKAPDRLAYD